MLFIMATASDVRRALTALAGGLVMLAAVVAGAEAEEARSPPWPSADRPAYQLSPYRGVTDGNGQVIPCRCRFQERDFRLGEEVCMSTHLGTVLARCDLLLNNTSWVPTEVPCTISRAPSPGSTGQEPSFAAQSTRSIETMRSSTNVTR